MGEINDQSFMVRSVLCEAKGQTDAKASDVKLD